MAGIQQKNEGLTFLAIKDSQAYSTIRAMSKTNFDVCIRGAGIVGRALALKLGQAKLRVALVDSGPPINEAQSRDIRAYALNHASRQLLESLRCWPEGSAITAVRQMEIHGDTNGSIQFDAPLQPSATEAAHALHELPGGGDAALAWIVDVPALEDVLATALRFQSTVDIVKEPVAAPLTAICEGKFSTSRESLGIALQGHDYPQHAIATRVKANHAHRGCARQWFSGPHIVALLPLGGDTGSEYAVVWSTSIDEAKRLSELSNAQFEQALNAIVNSSSGQLPNADTPRADSLCLSLIDGTRARWPLRLSQASHWCGSMADLPAMTPASTAAPRNPKNETRQATAQATQALQTAHSWVLLGDAAHTVHPLSGSGLNLGLGDVAALSAIVQQQPSWRPVSDLRVLRKYERERKSALQSYALATDSLQWLFWQDLAWLQTLRNWGMRGFSSSGPLKDWVVRRAMNL